MSDRSAGDAGSERDVVVEDSSIAVQRPRYLSTFELLLLALFAALVVAGNVALRFPIKMPGHSGIVWMALLVTARGVVPRPGAAAIVGLLSGLLGRLPRCRRQGGAGYVALLRGGRSRRGRPRRRRRSPRRRAVLRRRRRGGQPRQARRQGAAGAMDRHTHRLSCCSGGCIRRSRMRSSAWPGGYLGYLVLGALRRAGLFAYLAEKR